MSQTLNFTIRGLHTYPSDINGVPAGALLRALNVDLSKPNLAGPVRGFDVHSTLPSPTDRARKLLSYGSGLFAHYTDTLGLYSGGTYVSRGSLSKPTNATSVKVVPANQNLYLTSSTGIKKLESTATSLAAAGIPKGLHMAVAVAGAGTAVANGSYVAYRYLIARKDANKNTVFGGVSARAVIQNSAGSTQNVTVTAYIPAGLTTEHFLQLYRTAASTAVPNDEMQLTYEYTLTGTDISNGYVAITDINIDALLGPSLYTSPSQQGIANDNAEPPLASDIAEFKGHLFLADVESKHRYQLTLIATAGTSGLVVNDTLTLVQGATTETYTAKAVLNVASKHFVVDVASTSPSVRIDATTRSLVDVINRGSSLVYAYLLSTGGDDLPGKLILEARSLGTGSFTVASSRSTCWSPALAASPGTSQVSSNDAYQNGLMFAKPNQPEGVPTKNIFFVGSADDRIKRILALRDSLLIFKARGGVYALRGEGEGSFTVTLVDNTARVVAPDTLATVNNQVYGLFEAGICEISDSSVSIISLPIKDKLLALFGDPLAATQAYSFGYGYETEGKYYLALPSTSSDTYATQQLVFDVFNRTWAEADRQIGCAVVDSTDGKLYIGQGDSAKVKSERKAYDFTDFADYEQDITIDAQDELVLTVTAVSDINIGDIISQGDLQPVYVTAVDRVAGTVTVDADIAWDLTTAQHYKAIEVVLEWSREFAGNPAGMKHFSEAQFLFKSTPIGEMTATFTSDVNPTEATVPFYGPASQGAWGWMPWGDGVWGGDSYPSPVRIGVPRPSARCNALTVKLNQRVAYSDFQLSGVSLVYNSVSVRTSR